MRDAASSLARSMAISPQRSTSSMPMSRSDSSIHKVENANAKIASITADLANLQQREAELRTRLLRHMAAVLSLVLQRREEEEAADRQVDGATSPLAMSRSTPIGGRSRSVTPARFDGAHLFANNKDSYLPRSPNNGLSNSYSTFSSPANNAQLANLEKNLSEVESELAHAQASVMQKQTEVDSLRHEFTLADSRARKFEDAGLEHKNRLADAQNAIRKKEEEMSRWRNEVLQVVAKYRQDLGVDADEANLSTSLAQGLSNVSQRLGQAQKELEASNMARQDSKRSNQELLELRQQLQQVNEEREAILQDLHAADSHIKEMETRSAQTASQTSTAQRELTTRLDELQAKETKSTKLLAEIWKALPSSEARLKVSDSDDLKTFKACFTSSNRNPLGNFGLDLGNAPKFTIEEFVEKVRNMLADDKKLVERLIAHESQVEAQKANVERSQKMLAEAKSGLQTYQTQVGANLLV